MFDDMTISNVEMLLKTGGKDKAVDYLTKKSNGSNCWQVELPSAIRSIRSSISAARRRIGNRTELPMDKELSMVDQISYLQWQLTLFLKVVKLTLIA